MKLTRRRCLPFALSIFALAATALSEEAAVRPSREGEPVKLLGDANLGGLYTWLSDTRYEDPRKVFRMEDGMLHISGDGLGGITTTRAFRDYHLILEFKWGERTWRERKERARDTGVLVHGIGPDGAYSGNWMASIEANIIEGGVGDFIVVPGKLENGDPAPVWIHARVSQDRDGEWVWTPGGMPKRFARGRVNWIARDPDWEDVLGFRGGRDVDSPHGEWTRLDVICDGDTITNVVNGVVVNRAFEVHPTAGKITIQSELAEVWIRRWELWALGKAPGYDREE